jgi:hypothetical protein
METDQKMTRLRFGVFELDVEGEQLLKDGRLVSLQPQPFKLLCLLAGQAGKLVTREEIRAALWKRETFVDYEQGVNFAIAGARRPRRGRRASRLCPDRSEARVQIRGACRRAGVGHPASPAGSDRHRASAEGHVGEHRRAETCRTAPAEATESPGARHRPRRPRIDPADSSVLTRPVPLQAD